MTELEQALVALGRQIELPETPPLVARVRERLEPRPRPVPWRPLALSFAVLAIAFGAALAVPQARTAILRFLHLGGVTIERVETLPAAQERPLNVMLGTRVPLSDVRRRAGFEPVAPRGVEHAYISPGVVSMLFRVAGKTVLLNQIPDGGFAKKATIESTRIEPVRVNGRDGYWLAGQPHVLDLPARPPRFAGNVLIWTRGNLTLRLEGPLSKSRALELARTIR